MKLQIKVALMVIGILLVIGIISGGMMLFFQRRANVEQFEHMATALAGAVQGSLEQGMLTGEAKPTQEAMVRIGQEELVSEVALLLPDGTIAASSQESNIGKVTESEEYRLALLSGETSSITHAQYRLGKLWVFTPVLNEPECQGCHSPDTAVLGAIQVSLDATPLDNQTRQQTMFIGILGGLTFLIIGSVLSIALRKTILNPLSSLAEIAQRLSHGDYSARARHETGDEIGTLARTFNDMAESVEQRTRELEDSRQELAGWNIDLEDRIQKRTRQLSALNAVITTVSQSLNLDRILNDTLTKILSIVEMDAGAVHLIDTQADKLTLMAHQGISTKYVDEFRRLNPTQGVLGQVIQTSEPIIMDDTSDNDHAVSLEGEKGEFRAYIILPVISRNAVSGTLSLASYLPKKFEWETVNLLRSMCEAIGIAVENSRTAQSLEEANKIRVQLLEKLITAQEEERRRISRELHDDASQSLAALALNLEGLADKLPPRSRDARQKLDILKEQAIHTLEGIRSLALELRPSVLDDLGLPMAVDWYARDYMAKRGLDVDIQVAGQGVKLPPYTETMLFRIIQEGLTNIVKHAEASQVKVKLQLNNSTATVQLEDDGIGFDVKAALSGEGMRQNLGLHGMSERATLLGGTLTIQSQPGQGTSLRVEVPLGKGGLSDE